MRCIANKTTFSSIAYGNEMTNQVKYFEGVSYVIEGDSEIESETIKTYTIQHRVNGVATTTVLPKSEYKITVFGTEDD